MSRLRQVLTPSRTHLFLLSSLIAACLLPFSGCAEEPPESAIPAGTLRERLFVRAQTTLPPLPLPLTVHVAIGIESIAHIDNSFAVLELYLSEVWSHPHFNPAPITLSGADVDMFSWLPDTYFILANDVKYYPDVQCIHFDGHNVTLDRKVRLVSSCTTRVWHFPFDSMRCKIILSSYGYGDSELLLSWAPGGGLTFPVQYESLSNLGFALAGVHHRTYSAQYGTVNFIVLEGSVYLRRIWVSYVLQGYVPATLLVALAWGVFWINPDLAGLPGRACMGTTTVLAMLTLCRRRQGSTSDNVSRSFSLLDTYLWGSFVFVTLCMVMFAIGDFLRPADTSTLAPADPIALIGGKERRGGMKRVTVDNRQVDRGIRIVFPITFLAFISIYSVYVAFFVMPDY